MDNHPIVDLYPTFAAKRVAAGNWVANGDIAAICFALRLQ